VGSVPAGLRARYSGGAGGYPGVEAAAEPALGVRRHPGVPVRRHLARGGHPPDPSLPGAPSQPLPCTFSSGP